ncbi:hypothetical protein FVEN_g4144 [Fusarium venenatum]|uniref:Uncharacterized protein n=1 Tax=Fusarium venenatum TaxID=56646 RepID=A0A2L2TGI0_9HYPO|nr:uncharacterized protein FVRRES_09166 [Fusarium venenatum]KAG8358148.1 hypothetical protein FVEN_g4144 [Fusarium venenatum]KAH6965866.1 hypothetical protein EDB82DRAFT_529577 [Fusarium venenatum]CEI69089.1 unnamed protein product [Fusarium venenatum]
MTECFSTTQSSFGPAVPTQGQDNYYTVEMPECQDCDCADCAYTNTYTTTLGVFAPTGIAQLPYSVKEVYRGMSAMPADVTPTAVPYGFTSGVETCNNCGDEPITATMTYPRGGSPYQESVPTATPAADSSFEPPSTLRTEVADGPKTARLENTILEHKAIEYQGQADSSSNFAGFSLEGDSDSDSESKSSGGLSKDIKNYAKMRDTAPSRDADGAAMGRKPPARIAMALLVPIALLM